MTSNPGNQHFICEQKKKSVRNVRAFTITLRPVTRKHAFGVCNPATGPITNCQKSEHTCYCMYILELSEEIDINKAQLYKNNF